MVEDSKVRKMVDSKANSTDHMMVGSMEHSKDHTALDSMDHKLVDTTAYMDRTFS